MMPWMCPMDVPVTVAMFVLEAVRVRERVAVQNPCPIWKRRE